jgi:hypothetical protein
VMRSWSNVRRPQSNGILSHCQMTYNASKECLFRLLSFY